MKFRPFTKGFNFSDSELSKEFQDYLVGPIARWIRDYLKERGWINDLYLHGARVEQELIDNLQIHLRTTFPSSLDDFIRTVFQNSELTANFLALLIQNCNRPNLARRLENILKIGGSAYKVEVEETKESEYRTSYEYNFVYRVPEPVQTASQQALSASDLLKSAWSYCFRHNPDYEKTVSLCNDFIEGYLRDKFWPKETRTRSLYTAIKEIKKNPKILLFKGSSFLSDPVYLLELLEGVAKIRGEHTSGEGRKPTPDEAEYILHTTIYIWNLMENPE